MSKNYRDTLNLPVTDFSMKAGLSNKEPEILDFWNSINLYHSIRELRKNNPAFILHDGPPYANGSIHLGHSVNKILKDITIKHKTLMGLNAPYVPGWDCHGLPIELNVEKKLKKKKRKLDSIKDFQIECKNYALSQIEDQKKDFIRLGVLGEWDNPYQTLDSKFEADIVRSLKGIYDKGHIHKGEKPVHWCYDCGSALAEAEVEYQDKISKSIDVKFKVHDSDIDKIKKYFGEKNIDRCSFVIWTTTPWTIPANVAVSISPDISYSLCKLEDEHIVIANDLVKSCEERWSMNIDIISSILGNELNEVHLAHPLYDRVSYLIHGDHVTIETGTGCVHTAPAHGVDDHQICKKLGIETIHALNSKALFKDEMDELSGKSALKADEIVIEKLDDAGALINHEKFNHSYPHCWRHKTPLIFVSTPQWFISMDKAGLLDDAKNEISSIQWEPSWGKERIKSMLQDRPDWCISRQRNWGVPITLVVHNETGEIHPDQSDLFESFANEIEKHGITVWQDIDLVNYIEDHDKYSKIYDTLDVWFDSGVTHNAVSTRRFSNYKADLYLEGSDQHRGWFQSSLLTSMAINKSAPYKTVLTHGFVVDENGRKQSKSLGNVISPQKVWDTLGADILRLWVASTDFRSEMAATDEILKRTSDQYRRIRNTFRFILGNIDDFHIDQFIKLNDLIELDKWILLELQNLKDQVLSDYESFNYHSAVKKIHNFCVNELGGIYLDITKDRLYTTKKDSHARKSSQTSLFIILDEMVRLIAPVLSFTAEEIWQSSEILRSKHESVFLSEYQNNLEACSSKISDDQWRRVFEIKDQVNLAIEEARNNDLVKGSLDTTVTLELEVSDYKLMSIFGDDLHFLFITSEIKLVESSSFKVLIDLNKNEKCTRCWHRHDSVGLNVNHLDLCSRCIANIDGDGEIRNFV